MNLLRLTAATALAVSSLGSFAVTLAPLDLSTGSTGFFNTPVVGAFVDTAAFTLTTASLLTGVVATVVNGNQDVDFTSIAITGPSGTFNFSQLLSDPFEIWTIGSSAVSLAAGSYTLTLIGVNSAGAGSYSGDIAITAVPEPETLALMLSGIGVLGFVARRRKQA